MRYRTNSSNRARAAAVTAVLGALVFAMPTAGATVTRVSVYSDINFGSATNFGTNCTYTAKATLTAAEGPVAFYDNGIRFGVVQPSGGVALIQWIPRTTGKHTLTALQHPDEVLHPDDYPLVSVDVSVGTGVHLGYGCNVFGG
ncbi:hypothetical protein [Nocardia sp. NPDC052566]|uniref:hypothetical protein n=1 Tax=Nocardia sp. NPDC052566 TaxID=3364330 RepID=UPI0037C8107B